MRLPVTGRLQLPPPIPQHPGIELSDLHRTASHHDEASLALRCPVIEVCHLLASLNQQERKETYPEVRNHGPFHAAECGCCLH